MVGRWVVLVTLNLLLFSSLPVMAIVDAEEQPSWRSVGIDPSTWSDGPVEEDTPMKETYQGNAIFENHPCLFPTQSAGRTSRRCGNFGII